MNPGLVGFSNTGVGLYAVTQNDDNDPTLPTILAFVGNVGIGVVGQSNANGRQPPEYGGALIPGEAAPEFGLGVAQLRDAARVVRGDRQIRRPAARRRDDANSSSRQLL